MYSATFPVVPSVIPKPTSVQFSIAECTRNYRIYSIHNIKDWFWRNILFVYKVYKAETLPVHATKSYEW